MYFTYATAPRDKSIEPTYTNPLFVQPYSLFQVTHILRSGGPASYRVLYRCISASRSLAPPARNSDLSP
ncbi:hypothetical protein MES5069_40140 [Mesorhizobium escarrei]|uniref:Uncharacterized protein n=1 Tax=Mesorhizobium escarrei TaxID=666018 RepID=A0ABM9E435_9HYPH|nr:hypothetical protein MES5069_40140 [Mesorhizobium escarrei]